TADSLAANDSDVGGQAHMTEPCLERRDLSDDFSGARKRELASPGGESALHRRHEPDLWLPRRAVGVAALHAQQLLVLHPEGERPLDAAAVASDDAPRRDLGRASHRPGGSRRRDCARPLLEERLLEIPDGNADILAEREQLVLAQPFADVALPGLQLRGALDDAVERFAADQLS